MCHQRKGRKLNIMLQKQMNKYYDESIRKKKIYFWPTTVTKMYVFWSQLPISTKVSRQKATVTFNFLPYHHTDKVVNTTKMYQELFCSNNDFILLCLQSKSAWK